MANYPSNKLRDVGYKFSAGILSSDPDVSWHAEQFGLSPNQLAKDVWAQEVPYAASGNADIAIGSYSYISKKNIVLVLQPNTNGTLWFAREGGTLAGNRMRNFINPNNHTNAAGNISLGYTALAFESSINYDAGESITTTQGSWQFFYKEGAFICDDGYIPSGMGWDTTSSTGGEFILHAIAYQYEGINFEPSNNPNTSDVLSYDGSNMAWTTAGGGGTLDSLTDTDITTLSNDDTLTWNGTDWVNTTGPVDGTNGVSPIALMMTNSNHSIPVNSSGGNGNYVGSGTDISVFSGGSAIATGTSDNEWAITATTINPAGDITIGAQSANGANGRSFDDHSSMTADAVTINYEITIYRPGVNQVTSVTQSLSKQYQGTDGGITTAFTTMHNNVVDKEILTNADAAATALDRIQTGLDRVQTVADAAATALDRIQTISDVSASALSAGAATTYAGISNTAKDASVVAKDASVTAKDASVTAKDDSVTAKDSAEDAQVAAESARDLSVTAKDNSITAKDASVAAKDASVTAKDDSVTAKNDSVTAKDAAEAAEVAAEGFRDEITGMTTNTSTVAVGGNATSSYSSGVLSLGLPTGADGADGSDLTKQELLNIIADGTVSSTSIPTTHLQSDSNKQDNLSISSFEDDHTKITAANTAVAVSGAAIAAKIGLIEAVDLKATTATTGHVLKATAAGGTEWGASSSGGSTTVSGLTDTNIGTKTIGDMLRWNGTKWVNTRTLTSLVNVSSSTGNFAELRSGPINQEAWKLRTITGTEKYLQIESEGDLVLHLDYNNNATSDKQFKILNGPGQQVWGVDESGNIRSDAKIKNANGDERIDPNHSNGVRLSTHADIVGNITLTGTVDGVNVASRDAVLTSTTATAGAALPKGGGTITGNLSMDNSGVSKSTIVNNSTTVNRTLNIPDVSGTIATTNKVIDTKVAAYHSSYVNTGYYATLSGASTSESTSLSASSYTSIFVVPFDGRVSRIASYCSSSYSKSTKLEMYIDGDDSNLTTDQRGTDVNSGTYTKKFTVDCSADWTFSKGETIAIRRTDTSAVWATSMTVVLEYDTTT